MMTLVFLSGHGPQAVDKGGYQKELPDIWLTDGNPWEVKRSEIKYEIYFGGKTEKKNGTTVWIPNQKVKGMWFLNSASLRMMAMLCFTDAGLTISALLVFQVIAQAYDNPIPGYKTPTVGNLRLWDALPVTEFDLAAFNAGDYDKVT